MDLFETVPLRLDVNQAEVATNISLDHYNHVASALFANHNPSHPHIPIREGIQRKVIEVCKAQYLEIKDAPSPSLVKSPTATKKTKKKKRTLKKAAPVATFNADPLPPPIDFPLDDISLADLLILLPSGALMAEGSGDSSEGATFTRSITLLDEQFMRLEEGWWYNCCATFSTIV